MSDHHLPKLPTPTIIDGRMVFTSGQMREYGELCFEQGKLFDAENIPVEDTTKVGTDSTFVDELMSIFNMKK